MSVQTPQRSNLEDSLARLSQQMEDVEGRFNKLLGQDATSQRLSNRSSHVDSTVYRSSNNQNSHLKFGEPNSYATRNYSYSTNVNPLEQPRSSQPSFTGIERTYSVVTTDITPAANNYRHSETIKRSGSPVKHHHQDFSTPSKTITTTYEVKPTPQSTETKAKVKTEEDYPSHDFNDKELLALILNENSALKGSPPSKTYVHSHDPLKSENVKKSYILESHSSHTPMMTNAKVEEILRNIAAERASAGMGDKKLYNKPEDMKTYTSVTTTYSPSRDQSEAVKRSSRPPAAHDEPRIVNTQSTSAKNTEYLVPKSSLQYDNVYVPTQTYTTTTTPYQNTSPSNDNKKVEEWQYKKYLNESAAAEEEEEADSNFCGVCVSKRNIKPKKTNEEVKK